MSDLYRINLYAADAHDYDTGESGPLARMISDGVLVPVESLTPRLQDIADADLRPVADLVTELRKHIEGNPGAFNSFEWASRFRSRVLALGGTDK